MLTGSTPHITEDLSKMVPDLTDTQLLPQAFVPVYVKTTELDVAIKKLYGEHTPYYSDDAPGSLKEDEKISAADVKKINNYNEQFTLMINLILAKLVEMEFTPADIEKVEVFRNRILTRKFFPSQSAEFYAQVKYYVEKINVGLDNKLISPKLKKMVIKDLMVNILYCGPGIFRHLAKASDDLTADETIESWLANLRSILIEQLAEQHVKKNKISDAGSIHALNALNIYARDIQLNQYGFEMLKGLKEIHEGLAKVSGEDLLWFRESFFKAYTPSAIMTCISETLHARLAEKIKSSPKFPNLSFETIEEYEEFFKGLPLANHLNTLFKSHEPEEKDEVKATDFYFYFAGYILTIRSIKELKLMLTRLFLENDVACEFFKGRAEIITDREKFSELNNGLCDEDFLLTTGIVIDSPDICYFAAEDAQSNLTKICRLSDVISEKFSLTKYSGKPLTQKLFDHYFQAGERDFTGAVFDSVDLRGVSNVISFDFKKVNNVIVSAKEFFPPWPYKDVGVLLGDDKDYVICGEYTIELPQKFATLDFMSRQRSIAYSLYLDAARTNKVSNFLFTQWGFPNTRQYQSYTTIDKNTPLHYAVMQNNPIMVTFLLNHGYGWAGAFAINKLGKTPFQLALESKNREMVMAFCHYSDLQLGVGKKFILDLVMANDTKLIVEALTTYYLNCVLGNLSHDSPAPNYWLLEGTNPSHNNPLHYSVMNNNSKIIRALVQARINPFEKNAQQQTPIELATAQRNFAWLTAFYDVEYFTKTQSRGWVRIFPSEELVLLAAQANDFNAVKKFLQQRVKQPFAFQKHEGNSAIHYAVLNNNAAMVKLFIDMHPILTASELLNKNNSGQDAIEIAMNTGAFACLNVISLHVKHFFEFISDEYKKIFSLALIDAVKNNQLVQVKELIKREHILLTITEAETLNSSLHYAVMNDNPAMIKLLLQSGLSAALRNGKELTALQLAVKLNHWGCAKALIANMAELGNGYYLLQTMASFMVRAEERLSKYEKSNQEGLVYARLLQSVSLYLQGYVLNLVLDDNMHLTDHNSVESQQYLADQVGALLLMTSTRSGLFSNPMFSVTKSLEFAVGLLAAKDELREFTLT